MADNITLPGTGLVTATEDRAGLHFQKIIVDNLPMTAFGEISAAEKTPQVQLKFPYGIVHPDIARSLTNKSGSQVTVANGQATLTCSTSANAFCQVVTNDPVRYGPGQGAVFMGTYAFSAGVANSSHVFGAGDDDEGLFFGYNGTSFGILRRSGGSLELKELTVTAAATGSGNLTITLDGTAVTVAVTAGDTIAQVTEKIVNAYADFYNAGRGWEARTDDNVSVQFLSFVAENAAGSFSFSGAATGVTASFSEPIAGAAPTNTWVAQADWNIDTMDGNGPSGITLDPTKGNVYKVQFQYLGYGAITYSIENPTTGKFQDVHVIRYANSATTPTMTNPTLTLSAIIKTETGYSGGALTGKTASMSGFIEGKESNIGVRRSRSGTKTTTTTEGVVLALHNELDFNSKLNKIIAYPDYIGFSNDGSKAVEIILYKNPTRITGAVAHTDVETNVSVMQYSTTGSAITGGTRLMTIQVGAGQSGSRDLKDLNLAIRPGDRWAISARAISGAGGDVTVSTTWVERI